MDEEFDVSEDDLGFDDESEDMNSENVKVSIDKELANSYYKEAGQSVEEEDDQISLAVNLHLLKDELHIVIEEVILEAKLPYRPTDFQLLSLHILGSKKNLILISPTGSGKTLIIFLGTLLMRKILNVSKGVSLITEPLNMIMAEKLQNNILPTGVISMSGQLKTSFEHQAGVTLSKPEEEFLNGNLPCLFGHPESWLSEKGQSLIQDLHKNGRIILNVTDEMHSSLDWAKIRPQMKTLSGMIRIFSAKGAPTLAMTATATEADVAEMKVCLGLRDNVTVLRASPVQNHMKFVALRRPANGCGFDGIVNRSGKFCPGLSHILNTIYLKQFIGAMKTNQDVKKCIIFFRTEMQMLETYEYLLSQLPQFKDNESIPFVMNHSINGEATEKSFVERRNDIKLFLTTSKMLMGLDLANIQIIVFVRPMNLLHHILQGAGRAGRRQASGYREKVLVYVLYNSQDLGGNVPGLHDSVRLFCTTKCCLKKLLGDHFGGSTDSRMNIEWCCSNCDMSADQTPI